MTGVKDGIFDPHAVAALAAAYLKGKARLKKVPGYAGDPRALARHIVEAAKQNGEIDTDLLSRAGVARLLIAEPN